MKSKDVVLVYVDAINRHDVEAMDTLMTKNYKFIDTYDNQTVGKDTMLEGWKGYFSWFPDYLIEVEEMFIDTNRIAVFGYASASYHGNKKTNEKSYWRLPAAWKAVVTDNKISLWKVVCDSKIPYAVMEE